MRWPRVRRRTTRAAEWRLRKTADTTRDRLRRDLQKQTICHKFAPPKKQFILATLLYLCSSSSRSCPRLLPPPGIACEGVRPPCSPGEPWMESIAYGGKMISFINFFWLSINSWSTIVILPLCRFVKFVYVHPLFLFLFSFGIYIVSIEDFSLSYLLSMAAPTALENTMSAAAMASIPAIPAAAPGPLRLPSSSSMGTLTHLVSTSLQKWKRAEHPARKTLQPDRDSRTGKKEKV